jgi:uncharacterized protein (TIGR02147 family)
MVDLAGNQRKAGGSVKVPDIYSYVDYRHYVLDLVAALRNERSDFSYHGFAEMIEASSPDFLRQIRDRNFNLSMRAIEAIVSYVPLADRQAGYFREIVAFDQARTSDEKDRHFHEIRALREYRAIQQLKRQQFDIFSHWYLPAVRELVCSSGYTGDPRWLTSRIVPRIGISQAEEAVRILQSLNLIAYDPTAGRWRQTHEIVSTPATVRSTSLRKFHKEMIGLGSDSIERFAPHRRDIRSVTLGLSSEGYEEVRRRVTAFWKELLAYADTQKDAEQVVQVNMQVFPLTAEEGGEQ